MSKDFLDKWFSKDKKAFTFDVERFGVTKDKNKPKRKRR